MDQRKDLALAVAIGLFGVALVVLALQLDLGRIRDPIGPRTLPALVGGLIAVGSLIVVLRILRRWRSVEHTVEAEGTEDTEGFPASTLRSMAVWAVLFGYVLLLKPLGFLILTPPLLAGLLWIMRVRRWVVLIAISVFSTVALYLLFVTLLGVRLPEGPLQHYLTF
jgi:putative tricarboxylic transport membrane protein